MTRRALTTTTPSHPIALTVYGMAVYFGMAHVLLKLPAKAISALYEGAAGARVWGAAVTCAGLIALGGAVWASVAAWQLKPYRSAIKVEAWASLSMAMLALQYIYALRAGTPLAVGTQILTIPLLIGCALRSVQVWLWDLPRIDLAKPGALPADPPPAGDPTDGG